MTRSLHDDRTSLLNKLVVSVDELALTVGNLVERVSRWDKGRVRTRPAAFDIGSGPSSADSVPVGPGAGVRRRSGAASSGDSRGVFAELLDCFAYDTHEEVRFAEREVEVLGKS